MRMAPRRQRRRSGRPTNGIQRRALAVTTVAALASVSCSTVIDGTAQPATQAAGSQHSFGYVDDSCGLLVDTSVQQILGADEIARIYSGTVCQYVSVRDHASIDVVFSWFPSGRLPREREVAQRNHAAIVDTEVARHPAFLAHQAASGDECSATAATDPGVVSWMVQFRHGNGAQDSCTSAVALLSMTLSADM